LATKKARLAALHKRLEEKHNIPDRIIDAITISFGLQNIAPDTLRSNKPIFERLQMLANEILGRTTGANPFPKQPQFHQQFSIEGALTNQQTVSGVIAALYNEASKRVKWLPLSRESRRFAKKNISVGMATGLFNANAQRFGFGAITGQTSSFEVPVGTQTPTVGAG